ncbi:N-6 DNA methylase [Streptomyces sp. NPDC001678]|uniref:N-6 DNA methylase n=1 Tax=Streptomyces sp. NPDC001678 TaxID=3364599 RepID=UPI0036C1F4F8
MPIPPFNLKLVGDDLRRYDPRWRYGVPPRSNANFAWAQHVVSKLTDRGRAAMLLPEGAAFVGGGAAKGIREGLVFHDVLSAVVSLPPGVFAHTGISPSVWILDKAKAAERKGQVLFVQAPELGITTGRGRHTLAKEDIDRISGTYRSWCSVGYRDRAGWCRSVTVDEIAAREFNLQTRSYVGASTTGSAPQPAEQRVAELTRELYGHFSDAARLEAELRNILGEL